MSSTDSEAVEVPDWRTIVGQLVDDARKAAGNGEALAQQLESLGVGGEKGSRYSMSAISNWVKGRTMPPADVLLAVALVSGQSLDAKIRNSSDSLDGTSSQEVGDLRAELAKQQAEIEHLYSRVGEPYKRESQPPATGVDD